MIKDKDISANEYQRISLSKAGREESTPKERLALSSLGLAGETTEFFELVESSLGMMKAAGKICDDTKKHVYHDHQLDKEKAIKELGDIAWYLQHACTALGVSFAEVLLANIEKLAKRYPRGFNAEDSINRKD